jgi:hypothetical protein
MLAALPVRILNPIRAQKGIPPDSVIPGTALIAPVDTVVLPTASVPETEEALPRPVTAEPPKVMWALLSIRNRVVVALAVDEPMAKRRLPVSLLFACTENFANGEDVLTPVKVLTQEEALHELKERSLGG